MKFNQKCERFYGEYTKVRLTVLIFSHWLPLCNTIWSNIQFTSMTIYAWRLMLKLQYFAGHQGQLGEGHCSLKQLLLWLKKKTHLIWGNLSVVEEIVLDHLKSDILVIICITCSGDELNCQVLLMYYCSNKDYGELCRSDLITKDAALKVQEPEWWRKEEPESSCQGEEQEQVRIFLSFQVLSKCHILACFMWRSPLLGNLNWVIWSFGWLNWRSPAGGARRSVSPPARRSRSR